MRRHPTAAARRARLAAFALLMLMAAGGRAANAQTSQRGQPKTAFALSDFAQLRWLAGVWQGTAPGENTFYQRYRFTSDSSIDIEDYDDAGLTHPTGTARLYLSVARVYFTFGPGRWGATHVDSTGVFLVPQVNAFNTFNWRRQSADQWTQTQRSGLSGRERTTVYQMRRVQ